VDQELKQSLDAKFAEIDVKFAGIDAKFAGIDARLDTMDARLDAKFAEIDARFAAIDARFAEMEARFDAKLEALKNHLIEEMRAMQTEMLRGFASFAEVQTIRLRKLEADQSNLDASLSGRLRVVEERLLQIELRLGGLGGAR
jgi:flagellar biosynthesis/type III secretory pathway protein FliH